MLKHKKLQCWLKAEKRLHHTPTCNNIQLDGRLSKYIMMLWQTNVEVNITKLAKNGSATLHLPSQRLFAVIKYKIYVAWSRIKTYFLNVSLGI